MRRGSAAAFLILLMIVFTGQTFSCDKYTYEINNRCCPKCPPGGQVHEDCTELISTHCKPCTEGTFMDQPTSRRECYRCTNCEGSGLQIKMLCTIVSDTVCEPLEGFYCSDSRKDNCVEAKKHRRCEPGEYIKENGTSSTDTVCSTCSDGTFSDGTFTSCQKHKQCESEGLTLLTSGTKTENAQCGGLLSLWTGLIVGAVVMFLLIVLGMFCLGWWIRKHSGKRLQEGVDTEYTVLEMQILKSGEEPKVMKGLILAPSGKNPAQLFSIKVCDAFTPSPPRSFSITDIDKVEFMQTTNTLPHLQVLTVSKLSSSLVGLCDYSTLQKRSRSLTDIDRVKFMQTTNTLPSLQVPTVRIFSPSLVGLRESTLLLMQPLSLTDIDRAEFRRSTRHTLEL